MIDFLCPRCRINQRAKNNSAKTNGYSSYCVPCSRQYHLDKRNEDILYNLKCKFRGLKNSAKKRNLILDMNFDKFFTWWNEKDEICFYCGSTKEEFFNYKNYIIFSDNIKIHKYKQIFPTKNFQSINELTIDRKDNDKGYELENIVKCCWICNYIKGSLLSKNHMLWIGIEVIKDIKNIMEKE